MRTSFGPKRGLLVLLTGLACSNATDPDATPSSTPVAPIAARYAIDANVDWSVMEDVQTALVSLRDQFGEGAEVGTTTVRWAFDNDDRHVYVALEWTDDTYDHEFDGSLGPLRFDGVRLSFDEDGNGTYDLGEDGRTVIAASVASQFVDIHRVPAGESETDQIGDGFGKLAYDSVGRTYTAEFLVTRADDGAGEDGPLDAATRYAIAVLEGVDLPAGTGNVGAAFPGAVSSAEWPALPLKTVTVTGYPDPPTDVAGLIVFISDHDTPLGDIYAFDPSTKVVTRVTTLPGLYKDAVSLSPDRTRVAFHGAAAKDDYDAYEIYSVAIDGTDLRQLTSNAVLDGHPAWSPDGNTIAYASFRGGAGASIVTMTATGVEIADLTPDSVDDNDPDFLPDGRIVFKTSRYSALPEVRIAVMNVDGSGVAQLSSGAGSSDHDPTGDLTHVRFERFPKSTNYATDVEAGFVGWPIVEVRIADGDERTLVDDGWINWLPVLGPTGAYVVYLKGSGSTDAHLMSADGQEFGRLIPNHTRIRYIDWK